jgi:hypothetical protein
MNAARGIAVASIMSLKLWGLLLWLIFGIA